MKDQRFKVQGSRFRVQRFKVQGSKVQGSGFKGSRFRVQGSRFKVKRFKVQRFKGSELNGEPQSSRVFRRRQTEFRRTGSLRAIVFNKIDHPNLLFTQS